MMKKSSEVIRCQPYCPSHLINRFPFLSFQQLTGFLDSDPIEPLRKGETIRIFPQDFIQVMARETHACCKSIAIQVLIGI